METDELTSDSRMREYERTQDMIKHYDNLNLHFGIVVQTSVFILVGFAFGLLGKDNENFKSLFPFVVILVALLHVWYFTWFSRHRTIIRIKIQRILELERELGWKQFVLVDESLKSKKGKTVENRTALAWYLGIMPVLLLVAYFIKILA